MKRDFSAELIEHAWNRLHFGSDVPGAQLEHFLAEFDLIGGETLRRLFAVVKPGGKVVSIAGVPEPQTARKDLGRGVELAALFWLLSLPTRLRAHSHGVRYRYVFMHPSGTELGELSTKNWLSERESQAEMNFGQPWVGRSRGIRSNV